MVSDAIDWPLRPQVLRGRKFSPPAPTTTRSRLGDYFAEMLLLDQVTQAAKAPAEFVWQPTTQDSSRSSGLAAIGSSPLPAEEYAPGLYVKASLR